MKTIETVRTEDAYDLIGMLGRIKANSLIGMRLLASDGGEILEVQLIEENLTDGSSVFNLRFISNPAFREGTNGR